MFAFSVSADNAELEVVHNPFAVDMRIDLDIDTDIDCCIDLQGMQSIAH